MHFSGYGLPRIRLLGTWVNRGKKKGCGRWMYQRATLGTQTYSRDTLTIRSGRDWRANAWDSVGTVALIKSPPLLHRNILR